MKKVDTSQLRASEEYKALRTALIAGGLAPGNLDLLINTGVKPVTNNHENTSPQKAPQWSAEAPVFVPKTKGTHHPFKNRQYAKFHDECPSIRTVPPTPPSLSSDLGTVELQQDEELDECCVKVDSVNDTDNHEDRSVVLRGLSPFTTLADIAKVIRGGLVLNVFLRPRNRTAHVSFVDPIAAEKFIIHSKRSDIYIKGKRVCVI